jgi:hypothetical protein
MNVRLFATFAAVLLTGAVVAFMTMRDSTPEAAGTPRAAAATADKSSADVEPFPAPKGKGLLRITGVEHGNVAAHKTVVDFATLDRLAHERRTIREPFEKRNVEFTGLRIDELLARAGGQGSAGSLLMHALDDYHVELRISEIASDAMLATRANGKPIPIAKGGPIRLVFTSQGGPAANTDMWIWSIDAMRLTP